MAILVVKFSREEFYKIRNSQLEILNWWNHVVNSSFGIFLYRFDENNDGAISHKEMKKFVKDIQSLLTPSDLENISEHNLVKAITKQASVPSVVEF